MTPLNESNNRQYAFYALTQRHVSGKLLGERYPPKERIWRSCCMQETS